MSDQSHTPNQGKDKSSLQKDGTEFIANSDPSLLQDNTKVKSQYRYHVEKSPSDHALDRMFVGVSSLEWAAVVVLGHFAYSEDTSDQTNVFVTWFISTPGIGIAFIILLFQVRLISKLQDTKVTIREDIVQGWAAWLGNHGPKWFLCVHSLLFIIALFISVFA